MLARGFGARKVNNPVTISPLPAADRTDDAMDEPAAEARFVHDVLASPGLDPARFAALRARVGRRLAEQAIQPHPPAEAV